MAKEINPQVGEVTGASQQLNPAGVYKHPDSGHELAATSIPQADAYVQVGYKLLRELSPEDINPLAEELPDPEEEVAPAKPSKASKK